MDDPGSVDLKELHETGVAMHYNPSEFKAIKDRVEAEHKAAVAQTAGSATWKWSGKTELVSLLAYNGAPDYASLKSAVIDEMDETLLSISQGLVDWSSEDLAAHLAPGQADVSRLRVNFVSALVDAGTLIGAGTAIVTLATTILG